MPHSVSRKLSLFLVALAGLASGGCLLQQPTPDQVMNKFAQAMAGVTSFHYQLDLKLDGNLPITVVKNVTSVQLQFTGDVMAQDPNSPQFTAAANLTGTSAQGDLAISGDLANLSDYLYFRLTNLSLPTLSPVALGADSRWYKIRHPSLARSDSHQLGTFDQATLVAPDQVKALHDIISQTPLLEVIEVLPDVTINGQRSYHYRVQVKPDAIGQLTASINQLLKTSITASGAENMSLYQPDIWISKRTFQLSQFQLNGIYPSQPTPMDFALLLGISQQNEPLKIATPSNTEELTPDQLLKGQLPF